MYIHPDNPQPRLLAKVADCLHQGGIIVYPTDSSYALACHMGDKAALDRIRKIRGLTEQHFLTLVCRDLSEIGRYARVDNSSFRLIKRLTPGAYTFLLKASKEVPKRLQQAKRKTLGLRVPDHTVAQALLNEFNEPLLSTSLILAGEKEPLTDPYEIFLKLDKHVDMIVDCGECENARTTIIELYDGEVNVTRVGKGDVSSL